MRFSSLFFRSRFPYAHVNVPYTPFFPRFPYLAHGALIKRLKLIGYDENGGVCHGLTCRAAKEFLSNERASFNENLCALASDVPSTQSVTESSREFLTDIAIGQDPSNYSERYLSLQDPELAFFMMQNDAIATQGGIQCYDKFCHAYSVPVLTDYFSVLRKSAQASSCSFALILSNINHTIMVGFDHNQNEWVLADANAMPARRYNTVMQLARAVGNAFFTLLGHMIAFETRVFGTTQFEDQLKSFVLRYKADAQWQVLHNDIEKNFVPLVVSRNNWLISEGVFNNHERISIARRSVKHAINQCLCIASAMGDIEKVRVLLNQKADANFNNGSALKRAVCFGHLKVVCLLLEAGANVLSEPRLLAFAVAANYYDIAAVLVDYGLDPKEGDPSAFTIATQMKRDDFIDLFQSCAQRNKKIR